MPRAIQATRTVSRRIAMASSVKMRKLAKEGETLIDLLSRERLHLFRTEALHREGAHHAAIEHGMFETLQRDLWLGGKKPEESAGEGIASARGIHHFIQRQRRGAEGQSHAPRARAVEARDRQKKQLLRIRHASR